MCVMVATHDPPQPGRNYSAAHKCLPTFPRCKQREFCLVAPNEVSTGTIRGGARARADSTTLFLSPNDAELVTVELWLCRLAQQSEQSLET